ncbi:MAG: GNAT family N-acetyltransferase [Actinobacteria bacterium]|nr:GNAT family N-acetyltransferase [Actinomycetota bacterium]
MAVVVRDARADELDAVSALMLDAYAQYLPAPDAELSDAERSAWDAYRVDIGDVRSRLDSADLIVAADGDELLGAVTFYDPAADAHYPNASEAHGWPSEWASFRLLAVPPHARGKGIGRLLTEECIARARALGAPVLALHTTHLMDVAREMYKRIGWERVPEFDFFPMPDFTVEAYRLQL